MKSKTEAQLKHEFTAILHSKKEAFLSMFAEDVIGIEATIHNADLLTGKPVGPAKGKMHGMGSSITVMVGKGVKGKKYVQGAGGAIRDFKEDIAPQLTRLYPDAEIPAILLQDYTVNSFLQWEAAKWFDENGAKVDSQTFEN